MDYGLGRRPAPDERDNEFPMLTLLGDVPPITTRDWRNWYPSGWWGDQGNEPQCVGYAWAHWLEDGPLTQPGTAPIVAPSAIYTEARLVDEWPGVDYDGTSVRAGAKVLQARGLIESYHWAFDLDTIVEALLTQGPVVVGTNWYREMFTPVNDTIKVGGPIDGGHAYVLNAVNRISARVRVKNSWGRHWAENGLAWMSFEDLERLINEDGEACIAIERRLAA